MEEQQFNDWYKTEWIKHIADSGSIRAQLKLLTWLVTALIASNVAVITVLITVVSK